MKDYSEKDNLLIESFVRRNYSRWRQKYPNVTGAHWGHKSVNGKVTSSPCIVFHVEKKKNVKDAGRIPAYFGLKLSDGKIHRIKSDVIKTGPSVLHIGPGDMICNEANRAEWGAASLIVKNDAGEAYILGNMHVFGSPYMASNNPIYGRHPVTRDILRLTNGAGTGIAYFESGCVNNVMDAAIAKVDASALPAVNNLINGSAPTGAMQLSNGAVFPAFAINIAVPESPYLKQSFIDYANINKTFTYPFGNNDFSGLLRINPKVTAPGDSGSVIYDPITMNVLAIVLGADDDFSYGIDISEILSFFSLKIY